MKYSHKPHQKTGGGWLSESFDLSENSCSFSKKIGRFHPSYIRFKRVGYFFVHQPRCTDIKGFTSISERLRPLLRRHVLRAPCGLGSVESWKSLWIWAYDEKGGFYQTHWGVTCSTCSCDTFRCGCPKWKLFEIAQCTPGSAKKVRWIDCFNLSWVNYDMTITCNFSKSPKKVLVVQGTTLRCFPFVGFFSCSIEVEFLNSRISFLQFGRFWNLLRLWFLSNKTVI